MIGAGAAGLMAARKAACCQKEAGKPVSAILLDGNQKPGKKLLATGNGRCNLTNLHVSPENYHGDVEEAGPLLSAFPPEKVIAEFERMGLLCRPDGEGRVYPNSLQAASVLWLLWSACEEAGVETLWNFQVSSVQKEKDLFYLKSSDGRGISARRCILASGGAASSKHSCAGNGYELAKSLGHSVTRLSPALVPLRSASRLCRSLKGIRCKAKAALYSDGKKLSEESGEVIFGEERISGICIFNLSSYLSEKGPWEVELDLLEQWEEKQILDFWHKLQKNRPALPASELFSGLLNLKVGQELIKLSKINREKSISSFSDEELSRAVKTAKALRIPITGPVGFEDAQCTAGGVPLEEVDPFTMGSKKCPGLFLAGELLNLNGDCGGYNLHWAWITGMAAGQSAGRV